MVYNSRNSGGGGGSRYDGGSGYGGGGGGGFQPRRDTSLRRSGGGSQFGALDLPISSGRQSFGSPSSSVSPWASGQGPTPARHSWGGGGGAAVSDLGGRGGPDVFSQLGSVSSGGQSDTLNMATQLVSALLNQNQRQRAPQPFGGPAAPAPGPFGPPVPGYGARGAGGYRSARTSFDGGHAQYGHRADYNAKYDRRGEPFASPSRGRVTPRGRGAVARTRAAPYPSRSASATTGRSTGRQTADKSATKKKDQKKGVKTTQEAIDEAKAAALEKELEASDDKGKGAEGADLMSKDGAEGGKEGEAKADGDAKKGDAKDGEGKKTKPAKPQREKILPEHLNCTVCNVMNMKSEQTFNEHTRGRRHQQMMELVDQKLEMTAKLIRIEVQVGAKRAEQEAQRRNNGKVAKESGFCGMCNCKVYKDIQDHRFHDQLHAKLKKFLHPRCCGLGFETPVLYERHLISFTHFRKTQQREKDRAAAGSEALGVMGDPSSGTAAAAAAAAAAAKENGEAGADGAVAEGAAPAAEGAATEGAEATAAATEGAEGAAPAMEGVEAATEGQKPVKEPEAAKEPEKTIEDEEVPVTYDQDAEVATSAGVPFLGTFCTVCKLVMPDDFWSEHCRSRMHFTRFVVVRAAIDKAKKEAAEKEKKEAAEKEKKAAAAAAEEATEVTEVTVVEDEPESEETAAAGGEQRGTKRAAEEEEGAEAKKPATEVAPTDETGLDKMLDEMSEELDGKAAPAEEKAAEVVKEEAAAEVKTGEAAAEVKEEAPAEGDAEKTAEATTNGAEKPAEAAAVTEKPAAAAATTTPAKPAAAATPAKPAAATPAKPAAATPAKPAAATPAKPAASTPAKPAAATTPTGGAGNRGGNRGRGGRGGGGGGSPGRGGFARRRNRGRGGRF